MKMTENESDLKESEKQPKINTPHRRWVPKRNKFQTHPKRPKPSQSIWPTNLKHHQTIVSPIHHASPRLAHTVPISCGISWPSRGTFSNVLGKEANKASQAFKSP
jgi:hypothetical protein